MAKKSPKGQPKRRKFATKAEAAQPVKRKRAAKAPVPALASAASSTLIAPPRPPQPAFVDRGMPIPQHYGHDRIKAEVRDPNAIFIYWALEGPRCEDLKRRLGCDLFDGAEWIFRIRSEAPGFPCDIPVDPAARNWYLHVPENHRYVVTMGILPRCGGFVSVLCADEVRTPRVTPSDDTSCEWMLVEGDFARVERLNGYHPRGLNGGFVRGLGDRFQRPTGSSLLSSRVPGSHMLHSSALQRWSSVPPKDKPADR